MEVYTAQGALKVASSAEVTSIADAGGYYTDENVEDALQTLGSHVEATHTKSVFLPVEQGAGDPNALSTTGSASPDLISFITLTDGALEGAYWKWLVPSDYAGGAISLVVHFAVASSDAVATHTIRWRRRYLELVENTTDYGDAETVTSWTGDAEARTLRVYSKESAVSWFTPSGAGAFMKLALYRVGADAADTYVGNVRLFGIELQYTCDGFNN